MKTKLQNFKQWKALWLIIVMAWSAFGMANADCFNSIVIDVMKYSAKSGGFNAEHTYNNWPPEWPQSGYPNVAKGLQNAHDINNGNWASYSIDLCEAGTYKITWWIAHTDNDGGEPNCLTSSKINTYNHQIQDGSGNFLATLTSSLPISCNPWQYYYPFETTVTLPAGVQTIRFQAGGSINALGMKIERECIPQTPNLQVTDITANSISLSWTASATATGYFIYHSTDDQTYTKLEGGVAQPGTTYTHSPLTPGSKHYYKVSADDNVCCESVHTAPIVVKTTDCFGDESIYIDAMDYYANSAFPDGITETQKTTIEVFKQDNCWLSTSNCIDRTYPPLSEHTVCNAGWIESNDWTKYLINPCKAGRYDVTLWVAKDNGDEYNNNMILDSNGKVLSIFPVKQNSGNWQQYFTVTTDIEIFQAGVQTIYFKAGGKLNFLGMEIKQTCANPLPAPTLANNGKSTYNQDETPTGAIVMTNEVPSADSYQWFVNSINYNSGGMLIAGAESTSYTPPTDKTAGGTKYYYLVAYTGGCYTASETVPVTVNPDCGYEGGACHFNICAANYEDCNICDGISNIQADVPAVAETFYIYCNQHAAKAQNSQSGFQYRFKAPCTGTYQVTLYWTDDNGGGRQRDPGAIHLSRLATVNYSTLTTGAIMTFNTPSNVPITTGWDFQTYPGYKTTVGSNSWALTADEEVVFWFYAGSTMHIAMLEFKRIEDMCTMPTATITTKPEAGTSVAPNTSVSLAAGAVDGTGKWEVVSKPAGSTTASFSDASNSSTTFTPDVSGNYTIRWKVTSSGGGCISCDEIDIKYCENPVPVNTIVWLNGNSGNGNGKWNKHSNWWSPDINDFLNDCTKFIEPLTVIIPAPEENKSTYRNGKTLSSHQIEQYPEIENGDLGKIRITGEQVKHINKLIVEYGGATYINPFVADGIKYDSVEVELVVSDRGEWILVGPHIKPFGEDMLSGHFFRNFEPNVYMHELKLEENTASWQHSFAGLEVPVTGTQCFAIKIPDDYGASHLTAYGYNLVNTLLNRPTAVTPTHGTEPITYTWKASLLSNEAAQLQLAGSSSFGIACNTFLSNISVKQLLEEMGSGQVMIWSFGIEPGTNFTGAPVGGSFTQYNVSNPSAAENVYIKPMQGFMYQVPTNKDIDEADICVVGTEAGHTRYNARGVNGRNPSLQVNAYKGAYGSVGYVIYDGNLPSSAFDSDKDFEKLFSGSYSVTPDLYFELDGKNLHTQTFTNLNDEINLSIRYGENAGIATLKFAGINEFEEVYLEDKATGTTYNLYQVDNINVDITKGNNADRFVIKFRNNDTPIITGKGELVKNNSVKIYSEDNQRVIVSASDKITSITILGSNGQTILIQKPAASYANINMTNYSAGVYVVKAVTESGSATEKVVIK